VPARRSEPLAADQLKEAKISNLWPRTNPDVLDDLVARVNNAREEITVFGLTRNFYAKDDMLPLFEAKAVEIPVTFYVMDPHCDSRRDRYRIEPVEAAMEDPVRYVREILRPLFDASQRIEPATPNAGMRIFTFNFPCSFAMEKIDRSCRVMLYGHGKRGTEGPMLVFEEGTPTGLTSQTSCNGSGGSPRTRANLGSAKASSFDRSPKPISLTTESVRDR
jgi:hypothetical protein